MESRVLRFFLAQPIRNIFLSLTVCTCRAHTYCRAWSAINTSQIILARRINRWWTRPPDLEAGVESDQSARYQKEGRTCAGINGCSGINKNVQNDEIRRLPLEGGLQAKCRKIRIFSVVLAPSEISISPKPLDGWVGRESLRYWQQYFVSPFSFSNVKRRKEKSKSGKWKS